MPIGNYSLTAVTEPDHQTGFSRANADEREAQGDSRQPVLAKEPDRQSVSRRSTSSGRGRAMMEEEPETATARRGRSAPRASQRRATQPRRARGQTSASRRAVTPAARTGRQKKSRRGFAAMSPEQQREIARKGGLTVSRNRRHMADIGRVGGEHSHGGRRAKR